MNKITVVTNGVDISSTDVLDAEGNHIHRVQEIHVVFAPLESHPHGYLTRVLENADGSTKVTGPDSNGEMHPVLHTEDVDFIEIRVSNG